MSETRTTLRRLRRRHRYKWLAIRARTVCASNLWSLRARAAARGLHPRQRKRMSSGDLIRWLYPGVDE